MKFLLKFKQIVATGRTGMEIDDLFFYFSFTAPQWTSTTGTLSQSATGANRKFRNEWTAAGPEEIISQFVAARTNELRRCQQQVTNRCFIHSIHLLVVLSGRNCAASFIAHIWRCSTVSGIFLKNLDAVTGIFDTCGHL